MCGPNLLSEPCTGSTDRPSFYLKSEGIWSLKMIPKLTLIKICDYDKLDAKWVFCSCQGKLKSWADVGTRMSKLTLHSLMNSKISAIHIEASRVQLQNIPMPVIFFIESPDSSLQLTHYFSEVTEMRNSNYYRWNSHFVALLVLRNHHWCVFELQFKDLFWILFKNNFPY